MSRRILLAAGGLLCLAIAAGAAEPLRPGRYVTEGEWGDLSISTGGWVDGQAFELNVVGGNGHVCNLDGQIKGGVARLEEQCVVRFLVRPDRITVQAGEACRYYCGARAWFEGDYFPPIPFCERKQAVRDEFLRYYRGQQFLRAKETLSGLLGRCERFMSWRAVAEVRNDLAITELRLGNKRACLNNLEPLREHFLSEDAFFAPIDQEWGEAMVKTTRFNWKKCGGAMPLAEGVETK